MKPPPFGATVQSRLATRENEQSRATLVFAPHQPDGALQTRRGARKSPDLIAGFDGISVASGAPANGGHYWSPPDTIGAVGPNNYVEAVNTELQVFDRTGNTVTGPTDLKNLWAGTNGLCQRNDDGDPIVVYDQLADRWLISQFAVHDPDDYHECIAVSKTGDPAGAYWAYDFQISDRRFNDYPKIGVWPDAYYATFNDSIGNDYAGITVAAFDRTRMLNGQSAGRPVAFRTTYPAQQDYSMLPADLDGRLQPPAGSPALFVESFDGRPDRLEIWGLHVDFTGSGSTFNRLAKLNTAAFDTNLCQGELDCIPQPDTASGLDAISDRLMQPLAYRNFGRHESMVVNQTVDANGQDRAGIRWYELRRNSGGSWAIAQQSTYVPDSLNRWTGSMAMDGNGNIALGYSISSRSLFPSLRYATRLAGDPSGTLDAEATIVAGGGSQTSHGHRWGDYSTMLIDPVDDCTFWYAGEYYGAPTTELDWRTRIGRFKIPSCVGVTGYSPISGDAGASVSVTGAGFTSASRVKFSDIPAPTTYVSATTRTATVPAGSRTGQISVTTGPNTGVSAATFTVPTSVPAPTLDSFAPAGGITGSNVTISGAAFAGATSVKFNGTPALSYSLLSATSISAKVPDGATSGQVSVATPSGTGTSGGSYTVTLSVTGFLPATGRAGTRVRISGVGFNKGTRKPIVRLNGKKMRNIVVSSRGTRIAATVPPRASSGRITVQNRAVPIGTVSSAGTFIKR
jgi:hypothetical protein